MVARLLETEVPLHINQLIGWKAELIKFLSAEIGASLIGYDFAVFSKYNALDILKCLFLLDTTNNVLELMFALVHADNVNTGRSLEKIHRKDRGVISPHHCDYVRVDSLDDLGYFYGIIKLDRKLIRYPNQIGGKLADLSL
jgi:hypothetical protein